MVRIANRRYAVEIQYHSEKVNKSKIALSGDDNGVESLNANRQKENGCA